LNETWTIRLFGEFGLFRPDGTPVKLGYAKLQGLLAMLVVSRESGISRQCAIENLWPDGPTGAASLRQALRRLRKALGDDAILANRERCRLAPSLLLRDDYSEPDLRGPGSFMPDHEGTWFDTIRDESDWRRPADAPKAVHEGFLQMLDWYRRWDAEKLQLMMTADVDLVLCLPPREILGLVKNLPPSGPEKGWLQFWQGAASGNSTDRLQNFVQAYQSGEAVGDRRLMFLSAFELGATHILWGNPIPAERMVRTCEQLASAAPFKELKGKCDILRGLFDCHFGDANLGLEHLRSAERSIGDPIALGRRMLIRAFMEASVGEAASCEVTLQEAERVSRFGKEPAFGTFYDLAKLHLTASEDCQRLVEETGPAFLEAEANRRYPHLIAYVHELVATQRAKLGDQVRARKQKTAAESLRASCQLGYTRWDQARLRGYHRAIGA